MKEFNIKEGKCNGVLYSWDKASEVPLDLIINDAKKYDLEKIFRYYDPDRPPEIIYAVLASCKEEAVRCLYYMYEREIYEDVDTRKPEEVDDNYRQAESTLALYAQMIPDSVHEWKTDISEDYSIIRKYL